MEEAHNHAKRAADISLLFTKERGTSLGNPIQSYHILLKDSSDLYLANDVRPFVIGSEKVPGRNAIKSFETVEKKSDS